MEESLNPLAESLNPLAESQYKSASEEDSSVSEEEQLVSSSMEDVVSESVLDMHLPWKFVFFFASCRYTGKFESESTWTCQLHRKALLIQQRSKTSDWSQQMPLIAT